jgi:hypothetical protein
MVEMIDKLEELQEALDQLFSLSDPIAFHSSQWYEVGEHITELMNWREKQLELINNIREKFAAYRASLDLPVGEWLIKHAKTTEEIFNLYKEQFNQGWLDTLRNRSNFEKTMKNLQKQWVSVPEIQARLSGKVLIPEDQYENFKTNCVVRDKKEYESEIHIDRKQLSEKALEIDNPSNDYGEVCKQNRQYRILLKELLEGKVLPLCDKCKVPMKLLSTRDDGCRYFECPECGQTMGEETEEWFKQQEVSDRKLAEGKVSTSRTLLSEEGSSRNGKGDKQ